MKPRKNRGFTLTEALAAVLVASLVALAIAVGVGAAMRVYHRSVGHSEARLLSSTLSQAMMDELRYAQDIQEGEPPSFTSLNFGPGASFSQDENTKRLLLNGRELVAAGAYSGDRLQASAEVSWAGGLFHVTLSVRDGTKGAPVVTAFSVRPLNEP